MEDIPNEEYETQFFGFSPTDAFEGIKGIINDHFEDTLNKIEVQMKKIPNDVLSEQELSDGMSRLRLISGENIDNVLPKLKNHLLEKIMKVPPNMVLPEDAVQSARCPSEESNTLKEEIETLKMELKMEKFMEATLAEELKEIELVLGEQKVLLEKDLSTARQSSLEEENEMLAFLTGSTEQMKKTIESLTHKYDDLNLLQSKRESLEGFALK